VKLPDPPATLQARLQADESKTVYLSRKAAVLQHTEADVGKYYEIPAEIVAALPITHVQSHTKAKQPLKEEFERCLSYMMIRRVPWELAQKVKLPASLGTITALVGRRGTGKTACMNYLAQYALEQKDTILISTQGLEFPNEMKGFIKANNARRPDLEIFDQPLYTQHWFSLLLKANADVLAKVPLKGDFSAFDFKWQPDVVYDERYVREVDTEQRTLKDLAELGARNVDWAPDLLYRFVEEIYSLRANEPRVLVLVDDLNFWDHVSEFIHPGKVKPLPSRQLALVDAIARFTHKVTPCATQTQSLCSCSCSPGHHAACVPCLHFGVPGSCQRHHCVFSINTRLLAQRSFCLIASVLPLQLLSAVSDGLVLSLRSCLAALQHPSTWRSRRMLSKSKSTTTQSCSPHSGTTRLATHSNIPLPKWT
jgi:hypothetical protein